MKNKYSIAVRIETNESGELVVKRINYDRFSFHGFGSFIWKLKPEELSISQSAIDLLETRIGHEYTSMGDLAGLDFSFSDTQHEKKYNGYTLNYGFLGCELNIPIEDVLVDYKSFENIVKKAIVSEDTLPLDPEDAARWEQIDKLSDAKAGKIIKEFYEKEYTPKS